MGSFVMFSGCRVSGEGNDFKSYNNDIFIVIIPQPTAPCRQREALRRWCFYGILMERNMQEA